MSETQAPLSGRVVVDLSVGIPGGYCSKILADGGSEVIKVETQGGDPLRDWSASGSRAEGSDGALFGYLGGGKRSVLADPGSAVDRDRVSRLLGRADAVVWSEGSPVAEHPDFTPIRIRETFPDTTVVAITPFGLDGPWRGRPATEFTLQAWSGGILGLGRGTPERAPVHVGGQVGDYLSGVYAAVATLTAWRGGRGELIDLSMLETHVMCLTYYPVTFADLFDRVWRDTRYRTQPGVVEAKDGLVAIGCATAQQWFDLCAMVGHPEWIDESGPLTIVKEAGEHASEIHAWIGERTVEEVRSATTAFRIPNSPVLGGDGLLTDAHLQARGAFVENPRTGHHQPGPPYRLEPAALAPAAAAPLLGEHTDAELPATADGAVPPVEPGEDGRPFAGLKVLDLTAFWAGPSCTHILAMLGAEVVHVESTTRPDGTRFIGGTPMSTQNWWERSPIFSAINTNKRGITVDLRSEQGKDVVRKLVADSDVIVENFTPRVLEQLGLTFDEVRVLKPDAILVRMPGFGLDGPSRDVSAFAYVIEDAAGLTWLTGYPDQTPDEPYTLGDPNAGLHAVTGLLLALEHRRRTGEGGQVEASMVDAALSVAAEQVVERSAYGTVLQRQGNRGPVSAPQGLYLSGETDEFGRIDSWVAIAVDTDERWIALVKALGDPAWAADDELATAAGRRLRHDEIDEQLAAWAAERNSDEIVDTLWGAGVPVGKVLQPHRQAELPPLIHRGFYETLAHPVTGEGRYSTLPFRLSGLPEQVHRRHAPLLGEHSREVLAEVGLSDADLDELEAAKVIGREPRLGR